MTYIIGLGSNTDPQRIALQTRKQWDIPNAPKPQKSPEAMRDAVRFLQKDHASLKPRSLRSDYDCVGLVFGSRRTFIDIDHVRRILNDDGYHSIPKDQGEPGDLVLYEDREETPAHIGIFWSISLTDQTVTVLSQWGESGEYFHNIDDVKEDWRHQITVWTERLRP